jgi:HlyD family secretion protein
MKLPRGVLSLLTVLVVLLVLGGVAGWRVLSERAAEEAAEAAPTDVTSTEGVDVSSAALFSTVQPVTGVAVVQDTLWIRVVASGTAEANRQSVVATRSAGVVERVLVGESDQVDAGAVLVQLDTLEAALELAEARAALESLENQFEARALAGGVITDPQIRAERERNIRIQLGMTAAETRLERAEVAMELTRVTAPFAGRVADLEAVEGQFLGTGAEVLTLVQLDPIRVQAEVLEADLSYLSEGRRASVTFTAFPNESFEARVESVNPLVDVATRSGRVTLVLPNPGGRILPGMYARASLDAQSYTNRILIPREAVVERGTPPREVVFMASGLNDQGEGLAEWRYVTTGLRNESVVEIVSAETTSMLEPGEIVLVDGHHYLAHDTPVRLVDNVFLSGGRPGGGGP